MFKEKKRFLLLIFCFAACNASHCIQDTNAISMFTKNLEVIEMSQKTGVETGADEYVNALLFLTNVTGIMTRSDYSSTMGYNDKKDYEKDINAWKNWFKKNHCKLSPQYIDSVMSIIHK